jgi:rRNA maturation protein Nop10
MASAQPVVTPDLKPNEMEIRSKRNIELPTIKRPEVKTVLVEPTLFKLPTTHPPYVGNYTQEINALPMPDGLVTEIPNPPRFSLTESNRRTMSLKALGGQYLSREAELILEQPVTYQTNLVGEVYYEGTAGDAPFKDQPDNKSKYDELRGELGLNRKFDTHYHVAKLDGFWDQRNLFGATYFAPTLTAPSRNSFGLGGSYTFRSSENAPVHYEIGARYGAARFDTQMNTGTTISPTYYRSEKQTSAKGKISIPIANSELFANSSVDFSGFDTNEFFMNDAFTHNTRLGLRFHPTQQMTLMVGGQLAGYSTSTVNTPTSESATYVLPVARLDVHTGRGSHFYIQNDPQTTSYKLSDLFRLNPYLVDEPVLKPTINLINAEGGLNVQRNELSLNVHAGFEKSAQFLYFEPSTRAHFSAYKEGFFEANYGRSDMIYLGSALSYDILKTVHIGLGATLRDARLLNEAPKSNTIIPYFAPFVGNLSLTYFFPNGVGDVGFSGDFEGRRYTLTDKSQDVGGFMDFKVEAGYAFFPNFRFVVQVKNMGLDPLQRWSHYPQTRFVGLVGIQLLKNK